MKPGLSILERVVRESPEVRSVFPFAADPERLQCHAAILTAFLHRLVQRLEHEVLLCASSLVGEKGLVESWLVAELRKLGAAHVTYAPTLSSVHWKAFEAGMCEVVKGWGGRASLLSAWTRLITFLFIRIKEAYYEEVIILN